MSDGHGPALRRSLATWGAVGLSLAAMGPSLAVNINPQGSAATVGRAVPLTFALATLGVVLVAYGFARIGARRSHAGSVFALTGFTIGPRAGVVAGWSLLGAYTAFIVVTAITAGIFGATFLGALGLWDAPPAGAPWVLGGLALVASVWMAIFPVKRSTSLLLGVEIATVVLILLICAVVIVRVAAGSAPNGVDFTLDMLTVPDDVGASTLFLGVVFGFLSFAGFEAAATLGEEAVAPERAIPRAIFAVALTGGAFYVFVTACEMLGFGTGADGIAAFAGSTSLFGTLGGTYVAGFVGDLVTLGSAIAAIGCCLATVIGASRILFAMARGAAPESRLATVSAGSGVPASAAIVLGAAALAALALGRVAFTADAFDLFAWAGTAGTLVLLIAYGLFTAGAWLHLCVRGPRAGLAARRLDYVVPALALVVVGYTLYRNVIPWPDSGSGRAIVLLAAAWVLAAVGGVWGVPRMTRRIAARFAADEGVGPARAQPPLRHAAATASVRDRTPSLP